MPADAPAGPRSRHESRHGPHGSLGFWRSGPKRRGLPPQPGIQLSSIEPRRVPDPVCRQAALAAERVYRSRRYAQITGGVIPIPQPWSFWGVELRDGIDDGLPNELDQFGAAQKYERFIHRGRIAGSDGGVKSWARRSCHSSPDGVHGSAPQESVGRALEGFRSEADISSGSCRSSRPTYQVRANDAEAVVPPTARARNCPGGGVAARLIPPLILNG